MNPTGVADRLISASKTLPPGAAQLLKHQLHELRAQQAQQHVPAINFLTKQISNEGTNKDFFSTDVINQLKGIKSEGSFEVMERRYSF